MIGRAGIGLVSFALLVTAGVRAMASGQALVIGEASYAGLPALTGCAISAHAVAGALRGLGFKVDAQDDASSGALYAALGGLTRQVAAAPQTAAVIYLCGYATGFEDRPFVLPVSAAISRPGDVLSQGVLAKTLLNALAGGKPAAAVLVIDAVPMPKGPSPVPLDVLVQAELPGTLGLIATSTGAPAGTPTPLAAALVSLLHGPTVETRQVAECDQSPVGRAEHCQRSGVPRARGIGLPGGRPGDRCRGGSGRGGACGGRCATDCGRRGTGDAKSGRQLTRDAAIRRSDDRAAATPCADRAGTSRLL